MGKRLGISWRAGDGIGNGGSVNAAKIDSDLAVDLQCDVDRSAFKQKADFEGPGVGQ